MNGYTITNIDNTTGAVYATLTFDEFVLNETVFVEDVNNVDLIKQALETAYIRFQENIIENNITKQELSKEAQSLIGQEVNATSFELPES